MRDAQLGLIPQDIDYVVVGATPEIMHSLGLRAIGRRFPVFLCAGSSSEYALARTEKKSGSGHSDFECDFNPDVSLEPDLGRLDLTINAMALSNSGSLIEPF